MNDLDVKKLIFSDTRYEFSPFYRFLWRLVCYSFYIIFVLATALFVVSDITSLRWLGILFALFLIDRAFHYNQAMHLVTDIKPNLLGGINSANYISPKSIKVIENAIDKTLLTGGNFYLHVLKLLVRDKGIRGALWRLEIVPEEFEQKIDLEMSQLKDQQLVNRKELLQQTMLLGKMAFVEAYSNRSRFVLNGDLFAALSFIEDQHLKKIFYLFSIEAEDLEKALIFSKYRYKYGWLKKIFKILPGSLGGFAHNDVRHRTMNRAWTARPTPTLDLYSIDFTDIARVGSSGFLVGHKKEYEELKVVLARDSKPNVILLGEPGSGKETIMNHLAFEIVKDKVPEELFDKRLVSLQINDLISGIDGQEISRRVDAVIKEIITAKNIILYIPDIHNLFKTSGEGLTAADAILPAIKSGVFQVIGSTYPKEYKTVIEERTDFVSVFEKIDIEEISEDEATTLLTYESIILEQEYKVLISFQAIKNAVSLAHKYFKQKLLPSSAEDLLKEALAFVNQSNEKVLRDEHIIALAERKINVPIHKTDKEEVDKLLNLEEIIHQNIIGQDQAVSAVSKALREYRSGLSRSSGPIASFLFVGPTGVGKTELAKVLAHTQFGSENAMVRFDMSEYQDKQSIFRFIGSPDGKISGILTETVIGKPYCLILLDEFEKAHPDVLNIFLQVFDDGRLTDNIGRIVDFQNTIIIATSNANSEFIKEHLEQGETVDQIKDEFKKSLTSYFKPELLNRFSDVILFKNLSQEDTYKVAQLQLDKLEQLLDQNQGIDLEFSDDVIKFIAEKGYDPVFGARPLRTAISDLIKSSLSEKILKKEIKKGDKVEVGMSGEQIEFLISNN